MSALPADSLGRQIVQKYAGTDYRLTWSDVKAALAKKGIKDGSK